MNLSSTLANLAWLGSSLPAHALYRHALADPERTQRGLLGRLLRRNAGTAYGRAHGVDGSNGYEEFSQRVPLVDYEALEPWIRRIQEGEARVLTEDPVCRLVPTGGSAGPRKLIPFTATLQEEFNRGISPWMTDLFRQCPGIAFGPAYWSITPLANRNESPEPSAVPIGFESDSQYLGGVKQRLVNLVMATPDALKLVSDVSDFRYLTLLTLLRCRGLRMISVWHPSFLSLLLQHLPHCWEECLRDLRSGTCARVKGLPSTVRESLRLCAMPDRVAQLQRADPRQPETLWPDLKVVSCWQDAHAAASMTELSRLFPKTCLQSKGLLATEAVVTIPFAGRHPLAIRSHFYEFIDDSGACRLAHELEEGACYGVAVTTSGGLWRYRLGDRVQVNGFVGRTPSLRFMGRNAAVSDCCGEKLSEAFVGQAIRAVMSALGSRPAFALLAPEGGAGRGWHYSLFVEGACPNGLGGRLDEQLRRNPQYAWCRDLGQLGEIEVVPIRSGYESYVNREMREGRRMGEIKPMALSPRLGWREWFPVLPLSSRSLTSSETGAVPGPSGNR